MPSQFLPREFVSPKDASEVSRLLAKYDDRALIIGGGTLIHSLAARGILTQVELLIDIRNLALDYIRANDDIFVIGASTNFSEIENNEEILKNPSLWALKDALSHPPPQIRNSATIGGSVASAFPLFDIPIALLALQASVRVTTSSQQREIGLDSLYKDFFQTTLSKGEFITEIILPLTKDKTASAFLKIETNANDLAIVNVATSVTLDSSSNKCKAARIFIGGGVGPVPVRALSVEAKLQGKPLNQAVIDEVSQAIGSDVKMVTDHRASSEYRLAVTKVLLKRSLAQCLVRASTEMIRRN